MSEIGILWQAYPVETLVYGGIAAACGAIIGLCVAVLLIAREEDKMEKE